MGFSSSSNEISQSLRIVGEKRPDEIWRTKADQEILDELVAREELVGGRSVISKRGDIRQRLGNWLCSDLHQLDCPDTTNCRSD
jgi:hypothetical protein